MCDNNKRCLDRSRLCDRFADCDDKSDEDKAYCSRRTCLDSEFSCDENKCIPKEWECDSEYDCTDLSDENNCSKEIFCQFYKI